MITDKELREIRERCKRATPGPWVNDCGNGQVETESYRVVICEREGNSGRLEDVVGMYYDYTKSRYPEIAKLLSYDNEDDMYFIAYARTDVPKLLDEIERLKKALEGGQHD